MKKIKNIKLDYFHRDESNYKTFSSVIFAGDDIELNIIDQSIKSKLISNEFFYPLVWSLPTLNQNLIYGSSLDEFHEYLGVSYTSEDATDNRNIKFFINSISRQM